MSSVWRLVDLTCRALGRLRRAFDAGMSEIHRLRFATCGPNAMIRRPRILIGTRHVRIGKGFDVFPGLRLEVFERHSSQTFTPTMTIGDDVSINYDCHIGCVNRVEIGDRVLIASRVYITDHGHGAIDFSDVDEPPSKRAVHSKGPVVIESDVWIGEGACVMPGVRIGCGAIIGANAVVTRDVPARSVAAGIPARVIRRFD